MPRHASRARSLPCLPARAAGCLRLLLALAAAIFAAHAPAQSLEIIELRNRPAEQVIPLVRQVAGNATVGGSGFQLFVRASPADMPQIRKLVASLDRAQRSLVIHVRQDYGGSASASGVGGRVILEPGASRAQGSVWDRTGTAQDNVAQRLTVLEGNPAWIQTGLSTLVPQRSVVRTPGGVVVQESSVERNYNTGFSVTPRINGDMVFLDIGAERNTPAAGGAGSADVNRVATTLSGRLGEWIEVGGVSRAQSAERGGLLARSSDAAAQERRVYVKVEDAR